MGIWYRAGLVGLALSLVLTQAMVPKGLERKHRMSCPVRGAGSACLMPTCWTLPVGWQTRQENLVISVQERESGGLGCQEGGVGESGSWTLGGQGCG